LKKIKSLMSALLLCVALTALGGCGNRDVLEFAAQGDSQSDAGNALQGEEESLLEASDALTAQSALVQGEDENTTDFSQAAEIEATLCVYICGAIENPGVYEMPQGSRVFELVNRAGGLSQGAAADYINQADCLADAQRVYIPTVKEIEDGSAAGKAAGVSVLQNGTGSAGTLGGAGAQGSSGAQGGTQGSAGSIVDKVNINTADAAGLQTINGIGASRAADIVAYREANGPFSSIEDIMKVSGIKEGLFAKIRDSITVR